MELTRGPVSATQLGYAVEEIREILGSNAMKRTGQLQMPEQD